jgi:hypothetical protein
VATAVLPAGGSTRAGQDATRAVAFETDRLLDRREHVVAPEESFKRPLRARIIG